jgi:hypothetical protein
MAVMGATYVIWIVVGVAFAYACYRSALSRGRDPRLWTVLGFFFGIIALAIIWVMPDRSSPAAADAPTGGPDA